MFSKHPKILWADVGSRLGVNTTELRSLRNTFGDLLGLDYSKYVGETIVPLLSHIESLRQEGVPDAEIRNRILNLSHDPEWPEEVLSRMQEAATAVAGAKRPSDVPSQAPSAETSPSRTPPSDAAPLVDAVLTHTLSEDSPLSTETLPERTFREIVFDLRREITTNAMSDRELVLRLTQCVQKLTLEVRDLKYAFLLASSRKDRKKGIKAISRLLSS